MDKRTWAIVGGTAVVSLTAGIFGGFLYARKTLVDGYEAILEAEIEELKETYRRYYNRDEFASPMDAARLLIPGGKQAVEELLREAEPLEEEVAHNIFDRVEEELGEDVIASEEALRTPDIPYIISKEEFLQNEMDYKQVTLTYFEGDDTLADEREQPIDRDEADATVGDDNLARFGHRSGDPSTVYIRNERIELDFEVLRSTGKYSEEVLGYRENTTKKQRVQIPGR